MADPPPPYENADKFSPFTIPVNGSPHPNPMYPTLPPETPMSYPTAPPIPQTSYDQQAYGGNPNRPQRANAHPAPTYIVMQFGPFPTLITCPYCQKNMTTTIVHEKGLLTWLLVGAMAFFGMWICCCVPFCIKGCMDVNHVCSGCHRFLGKYKRI